MYYLYEGGARAGKTWLICYYLCATCLKYSGIRILVGRYHFTDAKASLWNQTLLPLINQKFKQITTVNKSDFIITFYNGSQIWLAGFDDPERTEKVMGQEYAIIFVNEGVQIAYDTFQLILTRLNWLNVPLKFIFDCNPRAQSHWLAKLFFRHENPETKKSIEKPELYYHLKWLPDDNIDNLNKDYIDNVLGTMTGVKRKRLKEAIWCESSEGTVYKFSRAVNHTEKDITPMQIETWAGWDFGIAADVFIVWAQFIYFPINKQNPIGLQIRIIDEYCNNNQDYKHYADVVKAKGYRDTHHVGDPAGKARDAKLESWFTLLKQEGIILNHKTSYTVADQIDNANNYMPYVIINETKCPRMVEMFENWQYQKDKDGKVIKGTLPEHNEYSHPGTAWFYLMINKFPVKKGQGNVYYV